MSDTSTSNNAKAEIPAGVKMDEASKNINEISTATSTTTATATATATSNTEAETNTSPPAQDEKKNSKRKWGESKWSKTKKEKPKNMYKPRNKEREEVHPGSFAHKAMRDLFDVSLPEVDEMQAKANEGEQLSKEIRKGAAVTEAEEGDNKDKLPKRKVALLIQFLGTKYCGMQINEGKRTIQAEIELALFKAGLLAASNFGYPNKFSWSNSARTDKGVHSCAQVCSVKILFPTDDFDKVREMINEQLPDDIKVADMIKVPKTFCARTQRNKVRYQYMLPSFALQSREQLKATFESVLVTTTGRNVKDPFTIAETKALQEKFRDYRATQESVDRLAAALGTYAGTHKFHNYTSRKTFDEANASRYILSFTVQDRVVDKYGVEWIPTLVLGQSFLLHQIRKMMSMAMDAARGVSSVDVIKDSFSDGYMNVNTAPAQGLFLEMSYFENFNRRSHAGDPLDWHTDQTAPATLRWKKFKEEKVMSHIMEEEESQGNFVSYLFMQENHLRHNKYELVDTKVSRPRDNTV
eukprot:scaffold9357_cov267-Chaetoceros_neogracile.AAC.2